MSRSFRLLACSALCCFIPVTAFAAGPMLTGPNVITLPHEPVPFIWSKKRIVTGEKLKDGTCKYPVDVSVPAGTLRTGDRYINVVRAFDQVRCLQLEEEGVVVDPNYEPTHSEAGSFSDETVTTDEAGNVTLAANSAAVNGVAEVRWTDAQNPLMKPFRPVFKGIIANNVVMDATFVPPANCATDFRYGYTVNRTDYLIASGWEQDTAFTTIAL